MNARRIRAPLAAVVIASVLAVPSNALSQNPATQARPAKDPCLCKGDPRAEFERQLEERLRRAALEVIPLVARDNDPTRAGIASVDRLPTTVARDPRGTPVGLTTIEGLILIRDMYISQLDAMAKGFDAIRNAGQRDQRDRLAKVAEKSRQLGAKQAEIDRLKQQREAKSKLLNDPLGPYAGPYGSQTAEYRQLRGEIADLQAQIDAKQQDFDRTLEGMLPQYPELLAPDANGDPLWRDLAGADMSGLANELEALHTYRDHLENGARELREAAREAEGFDTVDELWKFGSSGYAQIRQAVIAQGAAMGSDLPQKYMEEIEAVFKGYELQAGVDKGWFKVALAFGAALLIPFGPLACAGISAVDVVVEGNQVIVRYQTSAEARSTAPVTGYQFVLTADQQAGSAVGDLVLAGVGLGLDVAAIKGAIKVTRAADTAGDCADPVRVATGGGANDAAGAPRTPTGGAATPTTPTDAPGPPRTPTNAPEPPRTPTESPSSTPTGEPFDPTKTQELPAFDPPGAGAADDAVDSGRTGGAGAGAPSRTPTADPDDLDIEFIELDENLEPRPMNLADEVNPSPTGPCPPAAPKTVVFSENDPAGFLRGTYGPDSPAARAYEIAVRELGAENVAGIAGSYAGGRARTFPWPEGVDYDLAFNMDKFPANLSPENLAQLSPTGKEAHRRLMQAGGSKKNLPSDLDIPITADIPFDKQREVAKKIFDETGVLVEFPPSQERGVRAISGLDDCPPSAVATGGGAQGADAPPAVAKGETPAPGNAPGVPTSGGAGTPTANPTGGGAPPGTPTGPSGASGAPPGVTGGGAPAGGAAGGRIPPGGAGGVVRAGGAGQGQGERQPTLAPKDFTLFPNNAPRPDPQPAGGQAGTPTGGAGTPGATPTGGPGGTPTGGAGATPSGGAGGTPTGGAVPPAPTGGGQVGDARTPAGAGGGATVAIGTIPSRDMRETPTVNFAFGPRSTDEDETTVTLSETSTGLIETSTLTGGIVDLLTQKTNVDVPDMNVPGTGGVTETREAPGGAAWTDPSLKVFARSLGGLGGGAIELTILNAGDQAVRLTGEGLVLEPVQLEEEARKRLEQELRDLAARNPVTARIDAYCLDFLREPPDAGTFFRIAGQELQQRYQSVRRVLAVSRQVRDSGLLNPDSDPEQYFHFVRQWAMWTMEEELDLPRFTEAFVEQTKKNLEQSGQPWTEQVEAFVRGLSPNRWADVSRIVDTARQ